MTLRGSILTVTLTVVCLSAAPAWAQGKRAPVNRKMPERPQRPGLREVERIEKMSPDQRRAELAKLPPERRQQMEQRLERLSKLTPEQRAALNKRYEKFQHLPPDRQDAVRNEIQHLRSLPEAERKARLASDEVKKKFSSHEQQLLREASGEPEL
jgi:hypothetical protein